MNKAAAVRLGKAFFWDVQAGSDGEVACATCHFHGGADSRKLNTINPGPNGLFESGVTGPGQLFPGISITTDDRVGSQGIVEQTFSGISPNLASAVDLCTPSPTAPFFDQRRVTGRNAPTVNGAVFNRDNFWDGRASHDFNGNDPFGLTANASLPASLFDNGSLASQAVAPSVSAVEMSCTGRPLNGLNSLGSKLYPRQPLQFQNVLATDSVLGNLSAAPANGLRCGNHRCTYGELIAAAFDPALAADAVNQFSRIWGQALQAYQATLVPDQTPLDRQLSGNSAALTASQQKGLDFFLSGKGRCTKCHAGPELTDASVSFAMAQGLINADGGDQGFHNLGVRPTDEDLGRGDTGPLGATFSQSGADADRGAFKTPGLRNVKLTAPYFHNGGKATIGDVVDFYARGGDFKNPQQSQFITGFSLSATDRSALIDFLTNALTDCRVEMERAPFDHPSLSVPNGPILAAVGAAGHGPCP